MDGRRADCFISIVRSPKTEKLKKIMYEIV